MQEFCDLCNKLSHKLYNFRSIYGFGSEPDWSGQNGKAYFQQVLQSNTALEFVKPPLMDTYCRRTHPKSGRVLLGSTTLALVWSQQNITLVTIVST